LVEHLGMYFLSYPTW